MCRLAAAQRKAHSPWDIGDTSADLDTVRALFASLIGASAEDICLTPSCSYAMSLAAHNLRHRISAQRRGVLVLADQMSSNVMPWQALCTSASGELVVVPRTPDHDWTAAVLARLDGVAICQGLKGEHARAELDPGVAEDPLRVHRQARIR